MTEQRLRWGKTEVGVGEVLARLGLPAAGQEGEFRSSFNRVLPYTDMDRRRRVLRLRPEWLIERQMQFEHALASHLAV